MSIYKNDRPDDFLIAIRSVIHQSTPPNEIILVVDGPIGDGLEKALQVIVSECHFLKVYRFEQNQGHAGARQAGLDHASNEYVAIMDSDDIALPDRFEKQISYLEQHPDVDALGGQIAEFMGDEDHIVGERIVPETDEEIKKYLKDRCPMNFVTVMAKKSSIQQVGGYIDWFCEEDYYLWVRMTLSNCRFANLPDVLVHVRVGADMYARRGGWKYFKSEAKLQYYMFKKDIISIFTLSYNVLVRFVLQVCMTNAMRGFVFRKLARK